MKVFALIPLLLIATGCATVTTAHNFRDVDIESNETPIETVMIENTEWKLLQFIPIGSGNPEKPNRCSSLLFENSANLQNNLDILEREMRSVGATRIVNLSSKTIDESVFILLLTRTACRTSAVLLK